jgi:prepilin signal peptidase PulO-like enzyme (type II secretory pathway)
MNPLVGLALGGLIGIAALGPIRWLPRGIPERVRQPRWTWRVTRAPLVVTMSALIGMGLARGTATPREFAAAVCVLAVAVPAAVIDLRWRVIPDSIVVGGLLGATVILLVSAPGDLAQHALIALVGGGALAFVSLLSRGGLGFGDAKLVAALAMMLGLALPLALAAATLLAALCAPLVLLLRGRRATVPLGPFLVAGALVASVAGTVAAG